MRTLEQDIHLHVAEYARAHVFVHAGVVGWQGRALVFPSRSFADKSTLVVRLLAAGASYYSDEYAALDDRGWVHPFPRPLSLRTEERARRLPYTAFGATRGVEPLPVSAVVMISYRHGAGAVQAHDLRLPPPRAGTPGAPAGDAARTHAGRASAPALCYMNVRKTA